MLTSFWQPSGGKPYIQLKPVCLQTDRQGLRLLSTTGPLCDFRVTGSSPETVCLAGSAQTGTRQALSRGARLQLRADNAPPCRSFAGMTELRTFFLAQSGWFLATLPRSPPLR